MARAARHPDLNGMPWLAQFSSPFARRASDWIARALLRLTAMSEEHDQTDSLPTRPTLLGRLANLSDDASWREFYLTYEEHVRGIARRRGLQEADAQDVAQDVFRRVAQTIHKFKRSPRRGSFRSWLFQLTRWRSTDKLRERSRDGLHGAVADDRPPEDGSSRSALDQVPSPPTIHQQFELEAQRDLLESLLARVERSVSKKNIQIFQMVVLDDVPVVRVAELFHTKPAAVYVIRHRVLEKLRAEVAELTPALD